MFLWIPYGYRAIFFGFERVWPVFIYLILFIASHKINPPSNSPIISLSGSHHNSLEENVISFPYKTTTSEKTASTTTIKDFQLV